MKVEHLGTGKDTYSILELKLNTPPSSDSANLKIYVEDDWVEVEFSDKVKQISAFISLKDFESFIKEYKKRRKQKEEE